MEYDHYLCPKSSLDIDFHSFGAFNADIFLAHMENVNFSSQDYSTGYLEDAIADWSRKKRRLLYFEEDQDFWNSIPENSNGSDDPINSSSSSVANSTVTLEEMKNEEEEPTRRHKHNCLPQENPRTQNSEFKNALQTIRSHTSSERTFLEKKEGMAYPFSVVKPRGGEGHLTLKDINDKILMKPKHSVKHPVGEFACLPCLSIHGLGISGKSIASLTRIYTQGRGSITVIRTK